MKKTFLEIICTFFALIMITTIFTVTANASETVEIVNLYDESKALPGIANTKDGKANGDKNYHSAAAIEVTAGDKLTIGPVHEGQGWVLTGFDASGNATVKNVKPASLKKTDIILNNAVILTYTVPKGTSYVRFVTSQMFYDSTLITKNYEFTKDEYFAYMDKAGVNVDYLRPTTAKEKLVNLFPASSEAFAGNYHATEGEVKSDYYRSCEFFPVKQGDILYFGSADKNQGYHLVLRDADGKGISNVTASLMVLYEDLGNGYGIYAYRICPDAAEASVVVRTGYYNDGITLATLNQPFTGDTYREMFGIDKSSVANTESPLYGLDVLFMGDSISVGQGDVSMSYKDPYYQRGWPGRIEAYTGAKVINASVGGSRASYLKSEESRVWIYNQFLDNSKKDFDVIVMHGGVNDSILERTVGKPQPMDTAEGILERRITTYIGGLQWIFHNVKKTYPDTTLFFIANHRLDGYPGGNAKNMAPYFDAAKELCEMYEINFIDLYNNEELNAKIEPATTKYLPDKLHLNSAGYDIITPYIIEELEAVLSAKLESESTEKETETPVTEAPTTETPVTENPVIDTPETEAPVADSGCGGTISANVISVISLITLAGAYIGKKKE